MAKKYKRLYDVDPSNPETEVIATIVAPRRGYSAICAWRCWARVIQVIVPEPAFPIHIYAVAMAGANVIRVPLGNDQAFLERVERVIEKMYPTPKMLILN